MIFLIAGTRNLDLISNALIREIGQPIHIGLPDYNRRKSIMNYYFDKNLVQIEGSNDLMARNIKSYISLDMFKKIATATQNFSGSDIEEVIIDAVCALNHHIANTAKVSTLFIAKNEYDFKDSPFYSGIISIIFPLVYAVELGSRLINTDAEEYLLSFCAIKQDEIRLQKKNQL